jgi:hypothetical protein
MKRALLADLDDTLVVEEPKELRRAQRAED